jgi:hypothetical protein
MLEATLRYSAFAGLGIVLPGLAVLRLFGLPREVGLVLPCGLSVAAGLSWLGLVAGAPWLFPAGVALLVATAALRRSPWPPSGPSLSGATAAILATVVALAFTQYRWNRVGPGGDFLLDPFVAFDTAFHVGLTRELTLGYPPQVPGIAGFPLGYHLGIDLVRASALRLAGIDPYDSIARFDVTLLAIALILALRGLTAAVGGSRAAVALSGFIPLATDFSFVFAGNPQAHWWADLLRGNVLVSLALANPVIPGLALTLAALTALARVRESGGESPPLHWLAVAAGLGFAVPFFKVFLGAHLLLGLLTAAILRPRDRRNALLVAVPVAFGTALLALGQGGATVVVVMAPFDLVQVTRQTLGLLPASGLRFAAFAVLWLVASFGVRAVGIPEALRALRAGSLPAAALATMALAAWPLGLLFRVSAPEVLPGQLAVNDAAYLVEQGGPLLAVFAAIVLGRWLQADKRLGIAAIAFAAALSLPATLQFVIKKARTAPDPIPAPMVRAMAALSGVSAPGEVILQRPAARYPPVPVILAGRRVPYERFTPWLTQFASPEALQERHETVYRFFHTTDPAEARAIAGRLGTRFLCLYGSDRVRFPIDELYTLVFEEPGARVYRLREQGDGSPEGVP